MAELVRFTVEPPTREVKCKYHIAITVGLGHAAGPTGIVATSVERLLTLISDEVKEIVGLIGTKL